MTMKKNIKSIIGIGLGAVALLLGGGANAQQSPMFTQYLQNPLVVNPAYAGSTDALSIVALSRLQWTGFKGAPITNSIAIHSPIKDNNLGIGFNLVNDKIGLINQTDFFASVSYKVMLTDNASLRLGLRAGGTTFGARFGDASLAEQGQGDRDPAFAQNVSGKFLPNIGFGAYFTTQSVFLSVAAPRLLNNEISFNNSLTTTRAFAESRHIFVQAGGLFKLSPSVNAKPSIGVRYVGGAPASIDVTGNFQFAEKFWIGAMYRFNDAVGGIFQMQLNEQFRFGYSYDFNTTTLNTVNSGSHELMIAYDFVYRRANIKSPRYF